MSCLRIRLTNILNLDPKFLDQDGYYYLDLFEDTDISHQKRLNELTNLYDIVFDYTIPITIPSTPKNKYLLSKYLHGAKDFEQIEIFNNSYWVSGLRLRVAGSNIKETELEIISEGLYWAKQISSKKMNTLDYGVITKGDEFKNLNTLETNTGEIPYIYSDLTPEKICYFPLVDYGDLRSVTDEILRNKVIFAQNEEKSFCIGGDVPAQKIPYPLTNVDLRPWHFVLPILRKIFIEEGFGFVSPILESEYGRRMVTYILDPKKSTYKLGPTVTKKLTDRFPLGQAHWHFLIEFLSNVLILGDKNDVKGSTTEILNFFGTGVFDVVADIAFYRSHEKNFIESIFGKNISPEVLISVLVVEIGSDRVVQYLGSDFVTGLSEGEEGFTLLKMEYASVHLKEHQYISVRCYAKEVFVIFANDIRGDQIPNYICKESEFGVRVTTELTVTPKHKFFWREFIDDDGNSVNSYVATRDLDKEMTRLDYIKGIAHLLNLKFYTDTAQKTVYALQPDEVDLYGELLEGFYTRNLPECDRYSITVAIDGLGGAGYEYQLCGETAIQQNLFSEGTTTVICVEKGTSVTKIVNDNLKSSSTITRVGRCESDTSINIPSLNLLPDSYDVQPPKDDIKSITLKFKNDLHKHRLDIGEVGEDIDDENPLFDATYLQEYGEGAGSIKGEGSLYRVTGSVVKRRLFVPNVSGELDTVEEVDYFFVSKNKGTLYEQGNKVRDSFVVKQKISGNREQKFDISPRVLLTYGSRRQWSDVLIICKFSNTFFASGGNLISNQLRTFNWAGHYFPSLSKELKPNDISDIPNSEFEPSSKRLYYRFDQDHFDRRRFESFDKIVEFSLGYLYYSWFYNKYNSLSVSYLNWASHKDFFGDTLRNLYRISHIGKPYDVIITDINDFTSCKEKPTEYVLQTYTKTKDPYCILPGSIETEWRNDDECEQLNQPDIAIYYDVASNVLEMHLSGLNTDAVTGVVFEYSYNGTDWNIATNLDIISASFAPAESPVYLRATVGYDECPDRTTQEIFYIPCNQILTERLSAMVWVSDSGSVCADASIIIPEGISYTLVIFTVDLGEGPVPYTEGTILCDLTEDITFSLETIINNCPSIINTITLPVDPTECADADLGLECVQGFLFNRTGLLPLGVMFDRVYYQVSSDGVTWPIKWEEWDNVLPVTGAHVRARRIVEFCGECPDICTPITYCECEETDLIIECSECSLFITGAEDCQVTWEGPDGFTATGHIISVENEGDYIATLNCGGCEYELTFFYDKPNAGTPTSDPIDLD